MCKTHVVILHSNLPDSHAVNVKSMHLFGDGLLSPVCTAVSLFYSILHYSTGLHL